MQHVIDFLTDLLSNLLTWTDKHAQVAALVVSIITAIIYLVTAMFIYRQVRLAERTLKQSQVEHILSLFPYIVYNIDGYVDQPSGQQIPRCRLENIGRGPGIRVRLLYFVPEPSGPTWYQCGPCDLGAGTDHSELLSTPSKSIDPERKRELKGLPPDSQLQEAKRERVVITCWDQFGGWHRFYSELSYPQRWIEEQHPTWFQRKPEPPRWEPWPLSASGSGFDGSE